MKIVLLSVLVLSALAALGQNQTGKASFYADRFEGRLTANGEKYKHNKLTAAHKSLPFGTKVKVTNLTNSQTVEVVINDRGPYVEGRVIDLSKSAAEILGFVNQGLTEVQIDVIDAGEGKTSDPVRIITNISVDENEFYDFQIERLTPNGYGVQIGTYQELVNLMRLSENLKSSYQKKVTVQVKVVSGVKYYGIILGQFPTRIKAEGFREELRKKFPDAFIVEYKKL